MNVSDFDLNLLKVFQALYQEGSVTRAAHQLGVTQPAASSSLKRLREAVGDPLFVRVGHRLEPTLFATKLRDDISRAIGIVENMLDHADSFDPSKLEMTFHVSGSDFFTDLILPRLLEDLRLNAPKMKIVFVDQVFGTTLDHLENGRVDIAFWPEIDFPKWVVRKHLVTTRFELIARESHKRLDAAGIGEGDAIPLDLYCDLSHVHFSPEGRTADDIDAILATHGRSRKIICTVPTFAAIVAIVRDSEIIGTLPSHLIDIVQDRENFTRHPLPLKRADIPLAMIWHRRADQSPAHRWLRQEIENCFQTG